VPGWKLIEGKRSREWTLEEEALLNEFRRMGLSKHASYTHKLLTPAQAEKQEKIAGSRKYRKRLSELWRYKAGRPTLAPESDPAPAVDGAHPQEMFEQVEDTSSLPDFL
jgi:hypothetical protein